MLIIKTPDSVPQFQPNHSEQVRRMFSKIASRYDLMNRLMSAGQDLRWRRIAIEIVELNEGDVLLDVAAGTGDMVELAIESQPDLEIVAVDFTLEMMKTGRERFSQDGMTENTLWTGADTYTLPFPDSSFDAVTSAFLLRNLTEPTLAICEQTRVLKPGKRLVALDATPPPDNALKPLVNLYLNKVFPLLGGLIAGQREAYQYLPRSIASFLRPEAIVRLFQRAGLENVSHRNFMMGTAAVVVGTKPELI